MSRTGSGLGIAALGDKWKMKGGEASHDITPLLTS